MGVTVHFFAFDPAHYGGRPTIARWTAAGDLDEQLEVAEAATARLRPVTSYLGGNKRWYANIAAAHAWELARPHVSEERRAALDHWLGHFFAPPPHDPARGCPVAPTITAEHESVYDAATLRHIVELACDLGPLYDALARARELDPTVLTLYDRCEPFEFEEFEELVLERLAILRRVRKVDPSWGLLQWVWI